MSHPRSLDLQTFERGAGISLGAFRRVLAGSVMICDSLELGPPLWGGCKNLRLDVRLAERALYHLLLFIFPGEYA